MKMKIKKLNEEAIIPQYQSRGAAGFDFHALNALSLKPGERGIIQTGLAVALEIGYELQVRPRSGLAFKHGISIVNSPGTVDSDYRGEVKIVLINHGSKLFEVAKGDRVAQGVIKEVVQARIVEVDELDSTQRGEAGFGSTGR